MNWLRDYLQANAKPCRIETYRILITPEKAAQILAEFNTKNFRSLNPNRIKFYSRQMQKELWKLSELSFDEEGVLTNGQHRLAAVVESGVTAEFLVHINMPEVVPDYGMSRRTEDFVPLMQNIKSKKQISAYLKAMKNIMTTGLEAMVSPTELDMIADKDLLIAIDLNDCVINSNLFKSASLIAAFGRAILSHPEFKGFILEGLRKMANMEFDNEAMQPLRMLAKFMTNARQSKIASGSTTGRKEIYLRAARAVQAYIEGEKLSKLYIPKKDPFPIGE